MLLDIPVRVANPSGSYYNVPPQALMAVLQAIEKIAAKNDGDHGELIANAIERIDCQWGGHPSALDLTVSVTVIHPRSKLDRIQKTVMACKAEFRYGRAPPADELSANIEALVESIFKE